MIRKYFCSIVGALLLSVTATAQQVVAYQHEVKGWGMLTGPDGKTWTFIENPEMVNIGGDEYTDWRYNSDEVELFDSDHKSVGKFTIDLSGSNANGVSVYGNVTNHLFNTDDLYEVAVYIHIPGNAYNNYLATEELRIYNTEGKVVWQTSGNGVFVGEGSDMRFANAYGSKEGNKKMTNIDIYKPATSNDGGLVLDHQFSIVDDLINYMDAPFLNTVKMDDGMHYILCHYDKPVPVLDENGEMEYDPETYWPYWTPDNYFVLENYDENYNKVDELRLSTDRPEGVELRMMGVGAFSDMDVTRGYFTGDDKFNYIVMYEDTDARWNTGYGFYVVSQGGKRPIATICDKVGEYWSGMSHIDGYEDQWIFLQSDDMGNQQLKIVETPSCREVSILPARDANDRAISVNLDRYADRLKGYKYLMGINEANTDGKNVIAEYGVYDRNFTPEKYIQFNLGPNAETFNPLITNQSLDPKLFNSDANREYIFLYKNVGEDGNLYNVLYIGNEEGEKLVSFSGENSTVGNILTASILNYGTDNPELFVSYYDWDNELYHNEFISLPFDLTGINTVALGSGNDTRYFNINGQRLNAPIHGIMIGEGGRKTLTR